MAYSPTQQDILSLTGYDQSNRWNSGYDLGTPAVVTFSFADSQAGYDLGPRPGFVSFSEAHRAYAVEALNLWARSTGLTFVEVPDAIGGQIRLGMHDMAGQLNATGNPASGYAFYPGGDYWTPMNVNTELGGDVFINANFYAHDPQSIAPGHRGYSILIHEIGHALGFKHPFSGDPTIEPAHDNGSYTIMSYERPSSTIELGPIDVAVAQLYYGQSSVDAYFDTSSQTIIITDSRDLDLVLGTELNDQIIAGAGNDLVLASGGADTVFGGDGVDIFRLSGTAENYKVEVGADSIVVGTNSLIDVERIGFSDGTLAFDFDGAAGQAYRIYQAAFARTPDPEGLSFWINAMDNGTSLQDVATGFLGSAEFTAVYGAAPTIEDYVSSLYENILGRTADTDGYQFWVGKLHDGLSYAQALELISESHENVVGVQASINDGIWIA